MTDIVERLRNWETVYPEDGGKPGGSLYQEAVFEIKTLREALNKSISYIRSDCMNTANAFGVADWRKIAPNAAEIVFIGELLTGVTHDIL